MAAGNVLRRAPIGSLVEVEWLDAQAHVGWGVRQTPELAGVRTAGYLAARTTGAVLIAGSVGEFGDTNNAMSIPVAWIMAARRLS